MQIYSAFNSNGVRVVVSSAELDDAVRGQPPLSTQLADAAAQARRTDLIGHLRASLGGDDRARKLAAVATRLRGTDAAVELFCDPDTDPQLARLLVSNYNSHLRPGLGDVRFLLRTLQHYLERGLPWLTKLRAELWDNGVYLMLNGLSNEHAVQLLRDNRSEQSMLLAMLPRVSEATDDEDVAEEIAGLQAALSID